jgi:UDP-2-acetamido-3-amino-2,3-dideoxy-glucuronate N-acetyltransferase
MSQQSAQTTQITLIDHLEHLEDWMLQKQANPNVQQAYLLESQLDQRVFTEGLSSFPKQFEIYTTTVDSFQNEAWLKAYEASRPIKQIQIQLFHPVAFDLSSLLYGPLLQSALAFFEKSCQSQTLRTASAPKIANFVQHQQGIVLSLEFEHHHLLIQTTAISASQTPKLTWTHFYQDAYHQNQSTIEQFQLHLATAMSAFELEQNQSFYVKDQETAKPILGEFFTFDQHDNYRLYVEICQWIHRAKVSKTAVFLKNAQIHPSVYLHPTVELNGEVSIGANTKIWHFSKLIGPVSIGENCSFGQNVVIEKGVQIGRNVKVQNNVSIYAGVILEDDVFCGPSMVFTNVGTPRSHFPRRNEYATTLVQKGTSIGANATIVCGNTLGKYVFVGAGAVVTKDMPDYALVYGNPAKIQGWACYCGIRLSMGVDGHSSENCTCDHCGRKYHRTGLVVSEV